MRTLSLSKPHLVVMVGTPGSGKSFFAEHFAETFNAPLVSFDRLRSDLFDEPTYSADEYAIIERVVDRELSELFKTESTIIIDGSASQRQERTKLTQQAQAAGYETLFIWVQTDIITAKKRATKQAKSNLSENQFDTLMKRFSVPHTTEHVTVISGKHTFATQLKIVLKRLIEPRVAVETSTKVSPRPAPSRNIFIR